MEIKIIISVDTSNDKLIIVSKENTCTFFCFNTKIAKIEVYLPKDYANTINIINKYGDIDIADFEKANIDIEEDSGNVTVLGGNNVTINNKHGDIILDKASTANIKESMGEVKVGSVSDITIENEYGDIEIDNVNNSLNVTNNCGDIEIDSISLKGNSIIKGDLGDIEIGKTNEVYIDATTDLGDIQINNNYQKSDVTLTIKNSCGDITVNN